MPSYDRNVYRRVIMVRYVIYGPDSVYVVRIRSYSLLWHLLLIWLWLFHWLIENFCGVVWYIGWKQAIKQDFVELAINLEVLQLLKLCLQLWCRALCTDVVRWIIFGRARPIFALMQTYSSLLLMSEKQELLFREKQFQELRNVGVSLYKVSYVKMLFIVFNDLI